MRAIEVNELNKRFYAKDFILDHQFDSVRPIEANVKALVQYIDGFIEVEIVSVHDGRRELAPFLKKETVHDLEPTLRTIYLNMARAGLEGDVING